MEPIVSPWFVYWITRLDVIRAFGGILLGVGTLGTFLYLAGIPFTADCCSDELHEAWTRRPKSKTITLILIGFLGLAISGFVPSYKTALVMYGASKTTPDNIKLLRDGGKDIKDTIKADIIDIMESVNKKDNKGGELE